MPNNLTHQIGDVFQINEHHGRKGWIGAFVMATEIRPWGIQGFVSHVETHEKQEQAFIRLKWDEVDFIGHAPLSSLPTLLRHHSLETVRH